MQYLFLLGTLLIAVFSAMSANAETSAELEAKRLCENTYGYDKNSAAFEKCMKDNSQQESNSSGNSFLDLLESLGNDIPVEPKPDYSNDSK